MFFPLARWVRAVNGPIRLLRSFPNAASRGFRILLHFRFPATLSDRLLFL